ncbi:MAG: DUF2158 domain-containing protein [Gemmataceae bacterium]
MSEIQIGTRVRVHSGSTVMTATGIGADGIRCEWCDRDGILRCGVFPADALVEMEPDDGEVARSMSGAERLFQELLPGLQRLSSKA